MSDNKNDKKRRPLKNLPPERFQPKVLLIWLSIVAAVLALFALNPGKVQSPANLKIQDVALLADQGKVRSGVIRYDISGGRDFTVISGDTKEPLVDAATGAKTNAFRASGWEAYHVDGGLLAWVEAGLPLDPEDGVVAERPNLPGA